MPITLEWYNEAQQVLIQRFEYSWDWNELSESVKNIEQITGNRDIVLLADFSNTKILPGGNVLLHGKNNLTQLPDNVKHFIFVADSQLIKTFGSMIFNVIPSWRSRAQFVRTVDEGRKLVDKIIAEQAAGVQ